MAIELVQNPVEPDLALDWEEQVAGPSWAIEDQPLDLVVPVASQSGEKKAKDRGKRDIFLDPQTDRCPFPPRNENMECPTLALCSMKETCYFKASYQYGPYLLFTGNDLLKFNCDYLEEYEPYDEVDLNKKSSSILCKQSVALLGTSALLWS